MAFTSAIKHQRRNNVVVGAGVDQSTFHYLVKFKYKKNLLVHQDEFDSGISVEAFRFLRDSLNFTEKAIKSRGLMMENERGEIMNEGIVAALNSGMADISISLFELLPYRMAGPYGVRFLHAVFKSSKAVAIFTQPPKTSTSIIYGRPFETTVWYFIFALVFFSTIIFLTLKLKYKYKAKINKCHICSRVKFFMMCIFTLQGSSEDLSTLLGAPLLVFSISSVVFNSIYSSALTSIFAVDEQPISSFQQLIKQQRILYYDKYIPSIQNVLKEARKRKITVIKMGKEDKGAMKKASSKIFRSKAALLTTADRFYPYFKGEHHDGYLCSKLTTIPLSSTFVKSANFVKQGSPHRDLFNIKLLLMQQSGLIERLYAEHNIKTRLSCFKTTNSNIVNLDLLDTAFPFLLLCNISLLAVAFLLCEMIVKKFKQNSKTAYLL